MAITMTDLEEFKFFQCFKNGARSPLEDRTPNSPRNQNYNKSDCEHDLSLAKLGKKQNQPKFRPKISYRN